MYVYLADLTEGFIFAIDCVFHFSHSGFCLFTSLCAFPLQCNEITLFVLNILVCHQSLSRKCKGKNQ